MWDLGVRQIEVAGIVTIQNGKYRNSDKHLLVTLKPCFWLDKSYHDLFSSYTPQTVVQVLADAVPLCPVQLARSRVFIYIGWQYYIGITSTFICSANSQRAFLWKCENLTRVCGDLGHLISNIYLLPHVHAEITLSSDIMVLCILQLPLKILLSAAKLVLLLSQPSSIDLPAGTYHYLSQQGSDIYRWSFKPCAAHCWPVGFKYISIDASMRWLLD